MYSFRSRSFVCSFCVASILQNLFGLYFIISGRHIWNLCLAFLIARLNWRYALLVGSLLLFFVMRVCFNARFLSLHAWSNHGARCFSHLFGLWLSLMTLRIITPACSASSIRNSSTFIALFSLLFSYSCIIPIYLFWKSYMDV